MKWPENLNLILLKRQEFITIILILLFALRELRLQVLDARLELIKDIYNPLLLGERGNRDI
jgi:hypothetical protein